MTNNIRLSAPLTDWRSTIIKWASELRRIPFLFQNDMRFNSFDPAITLYDNTGAVAAFDSIKVNFARYRKHVNSVDILLCFDGNISIVNPASIVATLPYIASSEGAPTAAPYAGLYSNVNLAFIAGVGTTSRAYLQNSSKILTIQSSAATLTPGDFLFTIEMTYLTDS